MKHRIITTALLISVMLVACTAVATPAPTIVPTPMPILTPTPDILTIAEYTTAILPDLESMQENLDLSETLFVQAGMDPSLFYDNQWNSDVTMAVNLSYMKLEAVVNAPYPPVFSKGHDHLESALYQLGQYRTYFFEGLTEMDPDKINIATAYIGTFGEYLGLATEELAKFK